MLDTNIEYVGTVEFLLNIGKKSLKINQHNVGTLTLHQSICRFLAGQYRGLCDIPNFIDVRDNDGKSILSSIIPLTGRIFKLEGSEYIVQCDAQISYSQLIKIIDPMEDVPYTIILCADKDPDVYQGTYRDLAYISVSSSSLSGILPGTSAAIQWKLHIKNGS